MLLASIKTQGLALCLALGRCSNRLPPLREMLPSSQRQYSPTHPDFCLLPVIKLQFFFVLHPIPHCWGQGQCVDGAVIWNLGDLDPIPAVQWALATYVILGQILRSCWASVPSHFTGVTWTRVSFLGWLTQPMSWETPHPVQTGTGQLVTLPLASTQIWHQIFKMCLIKWNKAVCLYPPPPRKYLKGIQQLSQAGTKFQMCNF